MIFKQASLVQSEQKNTYASTVEFLAVLNGASVGAQRSSCYKHPSVVGVEGIPKQARR